MTILRPAVPLIWVGDSLEMVRSFPEAVKDELRIALYHAQLGGKHILAKPLHGIGPGVLEVVSDHRGNTFRAVYTVRQAGRVYVLHAFQKKSKAGIRTPKHEIGLIEQRLKRAIRFMRRGRGNMAKRDYVESSGNVFADLSLPNADERLAKAELAIKIAEILRQRRLTQVQAAAVLGVDQPKISALIRGRISGFSVERLLRFLLRLGADVSITVKPRTRARSNSQARAARRTVGFPVEGTLSIEGIAANSPPKSRRKQQRAA